MLLTLEIVSPNGEMLGPSRRKTVGPEGARIGRARDSDWVILDMYICRQAARVSYEDGTYYIEGLGRNSLAMQNPDNIVPNEQPQPLLDGDRFFLDHYEILATVSIERTLSTEHTFANGLEDSPFNNSLTIVVPIVEPIDIPADWWNATAASWIDPAPVPIHTPVATPPRCTGPRLNRKPEWW